MKADEVGELREQTLDETAASSLSAAAGLRAVDARRQAARARERRLGHRRHGRGGRLPRPPDPAGAARAAIDLTEDPAILTALANDIGPEAIFARQVIAYGRAGRRPARALHERRLGERAPRARRGAPARPASPSRWWATTAGAWPPRGSPTTSWSPARSTSRASRRRRPAPTTCCANSWSLHEPPASRARIEGTVQGVGFRPYVYRLADELGVAGHVLNDSSGVVARGGGAVGDAVERFDGPPGPSRRHRWRALERVTLRASSRSSGSGASRSALEPGGRGAAGLP